MPWAPNFGSPAQVDMPGILCWLATTAAGEPKSKSHAATIATAPLPITSIAPVEPSSGFVFWSKWTIFRGRPRTPPAALMSLTARSTPLSGGPSYADMKPLEFVTSPMTMGSALGRAETLWVTAAAATSAPARRTAPKLL